MFSAASFPVESFSLYSSIPLPVGLAILKNSRSISSKALKKAETVLRHAFRLPRSRLNRPRRTLQVRLRRFEALGLASAPIHCASAH